MKKIILYLILGLFTTCKAQVEVNSKQRDILVFQTLTDNVKYESIPVKEYIPDKKKYLKFKRNSNIEVYNKEKLIVISQSWSSYGSNHFNKYYSFIKDKDTMNITCECGQESNHYFKNLKFKKGNYELSFQLNKEKILGKQIKTPKEVQDILFKNSYIWWDVKGEFKNLYFKDLKFIEIDLKDTINVKLKLIE